MIAIIVIVIVIVIMIVRERQDAGLKRSIQRADDVNFDSHIKTFLECRTKNNAKEIKKV